MSKNKDLILEEIKAIRQSQTESQTIQMKILESLNTLEGESLERPKNRYTGIENTTIYHIR